MSKPGVDDVSKSSPLESLLEDRNHILTELYCVSRLHEFLQVTDDALLEKQIHQFLEANDIKRGSPFDTNTLPKFTQVDPPFDKKNARSKSSTPVDNPKKEKELIRSEKEEGKTGKESKEQSNDDSKSGEKNTDDDILTSKGNEAHGTVTVINPDNGTTTNDRKRTLHEATDQEDPKSNKNSNYLNVPPPLKRQRIDNNVDRVRATPVDVKSQQKDYLLRKLTKESVEKATLFNEANIDAKESVYLVMNDKIPSKIPQAVPLAELKYVSQTLPLIKLIPTAHKVITTHVMNTALNEGRIAVVSSRIEELRRLGLWSLRQPKRFIDPWSSQRKSSTHHGFLLEEAKWMFCDFDEFKKYKIAVCAVMAQAVIDFWNYGRVCCIKTKKEQDKEISNQYKTDPAVNGEGDSIDMKLLLSKSDPNTEFSPPELPSTSEAEYKAALDKRPSFFKMHLSFDELNSLERKIVEDIPLYMGVSYTEVEKDDSNELPFDPISKSTVTLDDDHYVKVVERQIIDDEPSLVPLSKRRGMFYGNRRSYYLRPPMAPSLRYLRYRTPTIWLPEDDQELVKNINSYAYNWDLISTQMSSRTTRSYCSNIERRTPWQCFERFVQLNEKFQFTDMKGPRAHNAQIWLMEAHKLQQQQKRRISPLGVGEESIQRGHKRLRWASMFEAMRKCIKKRENAPRPNPTQPRKPLDCKNTSVPTPTEMSQLKAQRDDALRRDIQMRRIAKQKLQAATLNQQASPRNSKISVQSAPQLGNRHAANKAPNHLSRSSSDVSKITTQIPQQGDIKPLSEKSIIESYARKILTQKPEFTPELALKAAESYYRSMKQRQKAHQEDQSRDPQRASQKIGTNSQTQSTIRQEGATADKILSPTPQEILQKIQQGK